MPNEKEYVKPFAQLIPLAGEDTFSASTEPGQDEDELPILGQKGSKN